MNICKILHHSTLRFLLFLLSFSMFSSCEKSDDNIKCGDINILKITTAQDQLTDISEGNLSDWIIIHGTGFCDVQSIVVNGVQVKLENTYIGSTQISLQIPRELPVSGKSTIEVLAIDQQVQSDFQVVIPELKILGFYNEYPITGEVAIIQGDNFDLYGFDLPEARVKIGENSISIDSIHGDKIFFTTPNIAESNLKVTLSNPILSGGEFDVPGRFRDNRNIIFDLDPSAEGWEPTVISNGPSPHPISGNYASVTGVYNAWSWNTKMHLTANVKLDDINISGSTDNLVAKFEVNVPDNWTDNPLKLEYSADEGNYSYFFPWGDGKYSGNAFKTNGWQTVEIPLDNFLLSTTGEGWTNISESNSSNNKVFRLYVHGGSTKEMEFYWDNFRIVEK